LSWYLSSHYLFPPLSLTVFRARLFSSWDSSSFFLGSSSRPFIN
jgi:hypothetical protein